MDLPLTIVLAMLLLGLLLFTYLPHRAAWWGGRQDDDEFGHWRH